MPKTWCRADMANQEKYKAEVSVVTIVQVMPQKFHHSELPRILAVEK